MEITINGLKFEGNEEDLRKLLGNVIDNRYTYTTSQGVKIHVAQLVNGHIHNAFKKRFHHVNASSLQFTTKELFELLYLAAELEKRNPGNMDYHNLAYGGNND